MMKLFFNLNDKHGITKRKKPVPFFDCFCIGVQNMLPSSQRAD